MNEQVEAINKLLRAGEPGNISVDEHSGYTGYKPQAMIDAMNEVVWGKWGFDDVSSEIVPGEKGALAVAQVRVWLQGIEFKPVGWGQNRVTRGDIGDARKGAQTDAIKKALSYFSIGNRAYHGLLDAKAKAQPAVAQSTPVVRKPTLDQMEQIAKGCKAVKRTAPNNIDTYDQADTLLRELADEWQKKASSVA